MKSSVVLCFFLAVLNVGLFQLHADESETGLQELQIDSEVSKLRKEQIQDLQEDIRDPFTPFLPPKVEDQGVDETVEEIAEVQLYGIGLGSESAYAILNGDVYYEGEENNGIKLLKVRKNEVEIETGGGSRTLSMLSEDELKRLEHRQERKEKARQSVSAY